jgi:hypothetical protein
MIEFRLMKLVRGLVVIVVILLLPILTAILGSHAAIRLGLRDAANGSLDFAFFLADAVGLNPPMLFA